MIIADWHDIENCVTSEVHVERFKFKRVGIKTLEEIHGVSAFVGVWDRKQCVGKNGCFRTFWGVRGWPYRAKKGRLFLNVPNVSCVSRFLVFYCKYITTQQQTAHTTHNTQQQTAHDTHNTAQHNTPQHCTAIFSCVLDDS